MAVVRLLRDWMKDPEIGKRLVPIAPDEYRTFGMDSMFPSAKVYNPAGQQYESVDRNMLLSYKESAQGQMLHEGISEAGAMASATAAGSAYSTHGEHMIPFYIFYSMFGFQRTGDSIWAMADQLARGFLIGATAGRTTLTGEGLQHADGHSPLLAATNPAVVHYDPAFAYEVSHIMQSGLERMYGEDAEDVIFYVTVYNEPVAQPAEPDDVDAEGILKGIHHVSSAEGEVRGCSCSPPASASRGSRRRSGSSPRSGASRPTPGRSPRGTSWPATPSPPRSGTCSTRARARGRRTSRDKLSGAQGPVIAVSDYMRAVPLQIARWVPADYRVLGADGFGFADTRPAARRFFHIDAQSVVVQTLQALADAGQIERAQGRGGLRALPDRRPDGRRRREAGRRSRLAARGGRGVAAESTDTYGGRCQGSPPFVVPRRCRPPRAAERAPGPRSRS